MNLYETIKSFIDKIFQPPIAFLDLTIEKLEGIYLVTAQGLNVSQYLSIFADLPKEWQLVLTSLLASVVLLGSLLLVQTLMRMYYSVKSGVKWW